MSKVIFKSVDSFVFEIYDIQESNTRTISKMHIFLKSLDDVSVQRRDDSFVVVMLSKEDFVVAKTIREISEFLEKTFTEVEFDEFIDALICLSKDYEEKTNNTLETLIEIKRSESLNSSGFKDFCNYCDDVLNITLRDYQYKSAYLLSTGKGGFDFSVPGAGKTIITYSAYSRMKNDGYVKKILIVGPLSSYNAWYDEYQTCFGVEPDFENLATQTTQYVKAYLLSSEVNHKEITFINYEKARMLVKELEEFLQNNDKLLIIDEAHKVKNPGAATTSSLLEVAKFAKARILLTGTPLPNGYEDLYSLFKMFSPFKDIIPFNYSKLKSMTKSGASPNQEQRLRDSISPFYSRISKKYLVEIGELKEPNFHFVDCKMDEDQRELYDKLNNFCGKINDEVDQDVLVALKKAITIRKMQISANPALLQKSLVSSMDEFKADYENSFYQGNSVVDELIVADKKIMSDFKSSEIIRIINQFENGKRVSNKNLAVVELAHKLIADGKKVLIWDIFVQNMYILKDLLESSLKIHVELINGSVSTEDRQVALANFRNGSSMILVANPATLAESISLHRACQNAIYVNKNFNAAQFIQSKDRIHRINMPEGTTATYYFVSNEDSIDSYVYDRLIKKEKRMLSILDADDIEIGGFELEDTSVMSMEDVENSYMR